MIARAKGQGRILPTKGHEGTLGDDENILYLNCGDCGTTVYICQNSTTLH